MKGYILSAAIPLFVVIAFLFFQSRIASSDFFDANVEALSDGEIVVGQLCAWDKNSLCIYLDPYEEYEGRFI